MIFGRRTLMACMMALPLLEGYAAAKEVIIGLRTWKFTDGTELRAGLYTAKDGKAVLTTNNRKPPIPFDKFIPEHQKILEAVASGEIELLEDPRSGVENTISVKTTDPDRVLKYSVIGLERTWTRKDGKAAKGCLVNITDDEIYLLIGDAIWRMMVSDLGPADLAYLDGINSGTEIAVPARVRVDGPSLPVPGNKPGHMELWIDGARFLDSKPTLDFEGALAKAKAEISAKMAETAWSLMDVVEYRVDVEGYLVRPPPSVPPDSWRRCYQVTFDIADRKMHDAVRLLPDNADASGRCCFVYFDDGLPPQKKLIPPDPK